MSIITVELVVRCSGCGRPQNFISYNAKKKEDVFGKKKTCVYCGKSFVIKGMGQDNIISLKSVEDTKSRLDRQ